MSSINNNTNQSNQINQILKDELNQKTNYGILDFIFNRAYLWTGMPAEILKNIESQTNIVKDNFIIILNHNQQTGIKDYWAILTQDKDALTTTERTMDGLKIIEDINWRALSYGVYGIGYEIPDFYCELW